MKRVHTLKTTPASSDNDSISYAHDFWMPETYFQAAFQVCDEGHMTFLEGWLNSILTGGSAWHSPSETYPGGPRGVVWVARLVVKLVANIGASTGIYDKPYLPPERCDLNRINTHDHPCALGWWDELIIALKRSNKVLEGLARQRQQPPEDDGPDGTNKDDHAGSNDEETVAGAKPTWTQPRRAKKAKPPAKKPDSSDSSSSSDEDSSDGLNKNKPGNTIDSDDEDEPSSDTKGIAHLLPHFHVVTVC
jgi:hypothetical protein